MEKVHPLFQWQREPTADQVLELPLALGLGRDTGARRSQPIVGAELVAEVPWAGLDSIIAAVG